MVLKQQAHCTVSAAQKQHISAQALARGEIGTICGKKAL